MRSSLSGAIHDHSMAIPSALIEDGYDHELDGDWNFPITDNRSEQFQWLSAYY